MATVRRIGPGSAFKVGAGVYAFMGLLLGILSRWSPCWVELSCLRQRRVSSECSLA